MSVALLLVPRQRGLVLGAHTGDGRVPLGQQALAIGAMRDGEGVALGGQLGLCVFVRALGGLRDVGIKRGGGGYKKGDW